jgi:hypothetical protein
MGVPEHDQTRVLEPESAPAPIGVEPGSPALPVPGRLSPAQILALQRSAGNSSVVRMLSRAPPVDAPPAPPPAEKKKEKKKDDEPDRLMPKETTWQGLVQEGIQLASTGSDINGVVAIAGWAHFCDMNGRLLSRYKLRGTFRLPAGVYLMSDYATFPVNKEGYAEAGKSPTIAIPTENLPEELKGKKSLGWPDWLVMTPEELNTVPSPVIVLVVDMPMASSPDVKGAETDPQTDSGVTEKGFGSELEGDKSGKAAPLPQLSAEIVGLESQPVGGTGDYRIRISWQEASLDPLVGASWAAKPIAYRWELWQIKATKAEWRERESTERAKRRGTGEKVTKWSGYKADTQRRWGDMIEHAEQYEEDREKAAKEGRFGDQAANELNQALYSVEAITNAGGQVVDTAVALFTPANSPEREVGWKTPGMFVLRCVADIDPDAADEGRKWRPPSVAAKLITVADVGMVAKEALGEGEATLAEKEIELKLQQAIDLESGATSAKALALQEEFDRMELQTRGEATLALQLAVDKATAEYEKARATSPLKGTSIRDRQVEARKKELERLTKLLAFAQGRLKDLKGEAGTRKVHRIQAALASKVTGENYPLLLDINEPEQDPAGVWRCSLADVTSQDGRVYDGEGDSAISAIMNALSDFADRAEYGEGTIAVKLPAKLGAQALAGGFRERTLVSKARNWQATKARLTELATLLGIIATVAVPEVGVIGALIGAGLAAEHLYDRASQGTLRWDSSLVTDVISILGGVTAAGRVVGKIAIIQKDGRVLFVVAEEANRLGQAAEKFDTWVVNPGGIMWANLEVVKTLAEINERERSMGITSNEARRLRAGAFTSALNTNLGLFVRPKAKAAAGEEHAPPPGHEGPPPPTHERPPPPTHEGAPLPAHEGPPPAQEPAPTQVLPSEKLKARTVDQGRIPTGQAGDLIRATGDWNELKTLVDQMPPGPKRQNAEQRLAQSRADNLKAELNHVKKPPFEAHAFDSGTPGFRSDIDVTVQPKEKRPGFKGKPRPMREQILSASEAADDVIAGLRRRFKGDPGLVADIAVHAYIGEDAVKLSSPEERAKATALEHEVGYAELRRGMSDEQWAALQQEMQRQLADGSPVAAQALKDIQAMMRQGEEFHGRMNEELRLQEDLVTGSRPELSPEERSVLARDTILSLKRRQLAELFAAQPPDMVAILRLQAEIRWFAPGAYATESAFHHAVKFGQARKDAGKESATRAGREAPTREDVVADMAVSWAEERSIPIEERRARLAAAADANLGMYLSHAASGGPVDQAKAAAKYGGRVLDLLDLAGIGESTPLAAAFNEFRSGKLSGKADPVRMLENYGKAIGADPGTSQADLATRFVEDATAWMTRAVARMRVIERTAPGAPKVPPAGGTPEHVQVETPAATDVDPDAALDAVMGVPPGPEAPPPPAGGAPPPIQVAGADNRAIAFQARFPKVNPSEATLRALSDLFRRTSSGGRSVTPRPGKYVPSLVRGAAPELKTIISFAARGDVVLIDLLPSTTAQRTPDMVVHVRQPDGSIARTRVEIRTLTGGGIGYQDVGEGGRNIATPDRIEAAIRSKVRTSSSRRSQLDVPIADPLYPGGVPPGGTLVVHLPRGGPQAAQNADIAMTALAAELQGMPHVQAIEFFLPGTATVRYVRDASGAYAIAP